ncbi:MAG: hypothetical protein WCY37_04950, partial [Candidatus Dojkabacteria bacterium]
PEENIEKVYVDPIKVDFTREDISIPVEYKTREEVEKSLEDTTEEKYRYLNGNEPIKDKETIEFMEGLPERVWEDTPEETEEWEDKIRELLLQLTSPLKPTQFAIGEGAKSDEQIISEIRKEVKQLLEERERETLEDMTNWVVEYYKDKWQIRDFDAEIAIQKFVEKKVSKLNK